MIVTSIPCIVRMNLLMSRDESIKSIRNEATMTGIHKASYKKSINIVKYQGYKECKIMSKTFSSRQYVSGEAKASLN